MLQHLVIGMIAPVLLVLAAPMTLLMRSISVRSARRLTSVLRSRVCHGIAHPVVALTLNVGGMGALYFSPLYEVMLESPAVHLLVHVHFLAAGCLFAWVIAGPDPGPRRPSVPARLVVLGVAITVHATLSQLLYAGLFVSLPVSSQELRGGVGMNIEAVLQLPPLARYYVVIQAATADNYNMHEPYHLTLMPTF